MTIVCGDLNVCLRKEPKNAFSQGMEGMGLKQIVKEATHVMGGQIDHIYVSSDAMERTSLERMSPFFTDHDALCFTVGQSIAQVSLYLILPKTIHFNSGCPGVQRLK